MFKRSKFKLILIFTIGITYFKLNFAQHTTCNWMAESFEFLEHKKLQEIFFPGTHNSGAYKFINRVSPDSPEIIQAIDSAIKNTDRLTPFLSSLTIFNRIIENYEFELLERWSRTQNVDILDQLLNGIRLLDLRIVWDIETAKFKFHHSLLGEDINESLSNIRKFVELHPKEIIILDVKLTKTEPQIVYNFIDLVFSELENYLLPKDIGDHLTYQEIIARKKNIVFYLNPNPIQEPKDSQTQLEPLLIDLEKYKLIWNSWRLISKWADTTDPKVLREKTIQILESYRSFENSLLLIQWILTANEKLIELSILPFAEYNNLRELAHVINKNDQLNKFILEHKNTPINGAISDFFEETHIVDFAILRNRGLI